MKYYHGTSATSANLVIEALIGNGTLKPVFHVTPDLEVARNYGSTVVVVELDSDLTKAHIGMINKDGNMNKNVGHGIEVVISTPAARNELLKNIVDAFVL